MSIAHQSQAARTAEHHPLVAGNRLELRYLRNTVVSPEHDSVAAHAGSMPSRHQIFRIAESAGDRVTTGDAGCRSTVEPCSDCPCPPGSAPLPQPIHGHTRRSLPTFASFASRPGRDHGAVGFVAQVTGGCIPRCAHVETLSAAEVEIASRWLHVAVAHAANTSASAAASARPLGRLGLFRFLQRLPPATTSVTQHVSSVLKYRCAGPNRLGAGRASCQAPLSWLAVTAR